MSIFDVQLPPVAKPTLIIDAAALEHNLNRLAELAGGVPLRVVTKSIRIRGIVEWALAHDSVTGVMCYSPAEAMWLARTGIQDILVAYPHVDADTFAQVAADETLRREITFMVDSPEHVGYMSRIAQAAGGELNVAIDFDSSLPLGPTVIGAHRSPLKSVAEVTELGRSIEANPGVNIVGVMFYEAQVAGVQDLTPVHRLIKRKSMDYLLTMRHRVVDELGKFGDIRIVNGGGSGSVHITGQDPVITDIAVGSGLFTPTTFDRYDAIGTRPASYFVSPVVRRYSDDSVVTFSGGYNASGVSNASRSPQPVHPQGLKYYGQEGPGEVQTPLHGKGARDLALGDPVWFRHAKAGEGNERFDEALIVTEPGRDSVFPATLPTYRGEGKNFG